MKRYIFTGAPGSGKSSVIKELELRDYKVIHESATKIILDSQKNGIREPWKYPRFIDDIVTLQKERQVKYSNPDKAKLKQSMEIGSKNFYHGSNIQFYDRSPICTYALAIYLGFKPSSILINEIKRIEESNIYERKVFFFHNLGFIENTNARKITFQESLKFEKIHLDIYNKFGYESIIIPAVSIMERVEIVLKFIN